MIKNCCNCNPYSLTLIPKLVQHKYQNIKFVFFYYYLNIITIYTQIKIKRSLGQVRLKRLLGLSGIVKEDGRLIRGELTWNEKRSSEI